MMEDGSAAGAPELERSGGEKQSAAQARFGDKLVNTRSTTWRGLDEADRAKPPLVLLAEHPALMKRPLITNGDEMYLGWDKTTQAALGVG